MSAVSAEEHDGIAVTVRLLRSREPTTIIGGMEPELCPRPIAKEDAATLVGVLAVLQGHAAVGDLDRRLVARLGERAGGGDGGARLEAALDNLNQRLRYALGEYDDPPTGQ